MGYKEAIILALVKEVSVADSHEAEKTKSDIIMCFVGWQLLQNMLCSASKAVQGTMKFSLLEWSYWEEF